jgi:hypothetical protein
MHRVIFVALSDPKDSIFDFSTTEQKLIEANQKGENLDLF